MAVPPAFIEDVVSRTDILSLVSEYVALNQKGRNHWGLCPFHLEKSPSFSVAPDRNMYHCFGCKKGGGAINFLMEIENVTFLEAVESLAKRVGLEMPAQQFEDGRLKALREKIYEINRKAAIFYHQTLYKPESKEALNYLQGRALPNNTLIHFGLGFAPNRWDGLIRGMEAENITKEDLIEAGLATQNEKGNIYDRFRNRIIFPIINTSGKVIGFGGRVMDDSLPKYLNSPDTPAYDKSKNLYGLNFAKKSKGRVAILTEGYMDTIALHQAGFDGAIASLGTALTERQGQLLSRYFKDSIICYDSDTAGVSAAQRAIPILEKAGMSVRVVSMEGAKDPDEFIKIKGKDRFQALLEGSDHHLDYQIIQLKKKFNLDDMTQKVNFLNEISLFLANQESPMEREIYANKVAGEIGISKEAILLEVEKHRNVREKRENKKQLRQYYSDTSVTQMGTQKIQYKNQRRAKAEEGFVRVCHAEPGYLAKYGEYTSNEFSEPVLGRLFEAMKAHYSQGLSPDVTYMTSYFTGPEMSYLVEMLGQPQDLSQLDKAAEDYLGIMAAEVEKEFLTGDDALLATLKREQERKAPTGE